MIYRLEVSGDHVETAEHINLGRGKLEEHIDEAMVVFLARAEMADSVTLKVTRIRQVDEG